MKVRAASQDAADGDQRLPAFHLPFFLREEKSKWRVVDSEADFSQFTTRLARNSDADRVVRTRSHAPSAPAKRGRERTVVEGAPDAELRFR
jgi:hypothetical protein